MFCAKSIWKVYHIFDFWCHIKPPTTTGFSYVLLDFTISSFKSFLRNLLLCEGGGLACSERKPFLFTNKMNSKQIISISAGKLWLFMIFPGIFFFANSQLYFCTYESVCLSFTLKLSIWKGIVWFAFRYKGYVCFIWNKLCKTSKLISQGI